MDPIAKIRYDIETSEAKKAGLNKGTSSHPERDNAFARSMSGLNRKKADLSRLASKRGGVRVPPPKGKMSYF